MAANCLHLNETVVEFGCGTGHLLLVLAFLMPLQRFVGVDLNIKSLKLLQQRSEEAGLRNVQIEAQLIEDYSGHCNVALALHVCGSATDDALRQAQLQNATFLVAPCCVGKVKDGGMRSVDLMRDQVAGRQSQPKTVAIENRRTGNEGRDEPTFHHAVRTPPGG